MVTPTLAGPVHRPTRVRLVRAFCAVAVRLVLRLRVEGRERLPTSPAILCFNHLNWADPMVLVAVLPARLRLAMFGPKEADMTKGARNRLITWAGFGIPYRPEKSDLIETTRRVQKALDDGWTIAIAGEGSIHRGERELLPLLDGTAYFALRAGVPIVPLAINGTSWLGFRRPVRIRVGRPIEASGRPSRENVDALTARTSEALLALVADFPDPPPPGRFGRWLTELFNDWPGGVRPDAPAARPDAPAARPDAPAARPDAPAARPDAPAVGSGGAGERVVAGQDIAAAGDVVAAGDAIPATGEDVATAGEGGAAR